MAEPNTPFKDIWRNFPTSPPELLRASGFASCSGCCQKESSVDMQIEKRKIPTNCLEEINFLDLKSKKSEP